jgi:hypothetical protein
MADKILSAFDGLDTVANDDELYIVDVSDTTDNDDGSSKKISRSNLVAGLAVSGANSDITSLAGLTTPLSVAQGGSGAATLTGIVKGNGTSAFTAVTAPSGDIVGTTDTQTLTNKTITYADNTLTGVVGLDAEQTLTNKTLIASTNVLTQVTTTASSATPTPTGGSLRNALYITALAEAAELQAPSGTPVNGNTLIIRVKDDGEARDLTYNAIYAGIGTELPSTTVLSKGLYLGFIYNSQTSKWECLAVAQEE